MSGPFKVVVADPPWRFGDKLPGKTRGAERHYGTMSVDDIERFLPGLNVEIASSAVLFMWRVSSQVEEAMRVVRAWGFTPKSEIVWVKTSSVSAQREYIAGRMPTLHFGMGRYVRASHETCILATRGRATSLIKDHATRSVLLAPVGRHSEKPTEFYDLVERLIPAGPYLELFARRKRAGWECMGDEVDAAKEAGQ